VLAGLLGVLSGSPALGGAVVGHVVLRGEPAPPVRLPVVKDRHACGDVVRSEALVVAPDTRRVRNAVLWLDGVPAPEPRPGRAEVALENRGCRFVPHVLTGRVGDELVVTNHDDVLHNLRAWLPDRRALFNVVQPLVGQVTRRALTQPGVVTLTCDTHVHMRGYLLVFDHPYFALTGADGAFQIPRVPAGTYRLTMWHEGWAVVGREGTGAFVYEPPHVATREVVVPAAGEVRIELELTAAPR
jgi:plastocyanin